MVDDFKATTIIFDADGTLMKGENPYMRLAQLLNCHNELDEKVNHYLQGELDYLDLVEWQSELYKKAYFNTYGSKPMAGDFERLLEVPKIRKNVAKVIRELTLRGVRIFILSSGIRFLIRELSRAYVPSEAVYANRFVYDISGEFVAIHVEVKGDKVKALERIVNENDLDWDSLAYVGDNAFDIPIIKNLTGHGGKAFILEDSLSKYAFPEDFDRGSVEFIRSVKEILVHTAEGEQLSFSAKWKDLTKNKQAIIVCGLPGAGKTSISTYFEQSSRFKWLNTDQLRLGGGENWKAKYGGKLGKSARANIRRHTYELLFNKAIEQVEMGNKIVLDGTFMDENRDEAVAILSQKIPVDKLLMVVIKTDEDLVRERKKLRSNKWEQQLFHAIYEAWKKDLLMGRYWYPRKGDYPGVEIVEVVNGELVDV